MSTEYDIWGRGRTSSTPMGPLVNRLRGLEGRLRDQETSSPLQSASISSGGLTVKDGGNINVRDGGAITGWSENGEGYARMAGGRLEFTYANLEVPGRLSGTLGPTGRTSLNLSPPRTLGDSDPTQLILEGPSPANEGGAWLYSNGQIHERAVRECFVESTAAGAYFRGQTSVNLAALAGPAFISATGQVQITSGEGLVFVSHQTTGAAANCLITNNGAIYRSTSSRRYKQDIEDAVIDPAAVLQLRPRTWRDRLEVAADPTTTQRYIGFIAEELDELGLNEFVTYDEDGPESISYDRLAAALIPVVRTQQEQLDDLQRQVDELRALVAGIPTPTAPQEA